MTTLPDLPTAEEPTPTLVPVWDAGIRLFHGLLILLVPLLLGTGLSGHGDSVMHLLGGLLLAVLLSWRCLWGFVGSSSARFSGFRLGVKEVRRFTREGKSSNYGHNPLSAWMVAILLAGLCLQALSGMIMTGMLNPGEWLLGPLENWAARWHAGFPKLLLGLIAVHAGAAAIHALKGDRVVRAMIDGRAPAVSDAQSPALGSTARLIVTSLTALILVLVTILLSLS